MDRSQVLNDPEQSLRIALDGQQAGLWTAIPCIVVSVNWSKLTIEAQPAVQGVNIDEAGNETFVDLPVLGDVPLMFPAAGGFALTLPIAAGDEVLVVFASRAIDSWWQAGGNENPPIETRMHDLSDGFAIPAQMSNPKTKTYAPNVSQNSARLTTQDGTSYVEIAAGGVVNIVAPGGVNITGALAVTGAITATGEVTAKEGANQVLLSQHVHAGVTTGGGSTSAPTPGT